MSHYGIILILLPISMAGVLAMPHNERRHHHEESQAKNHKTISKRNDDRIDNFLYDTWEEIEIINIYAPKCAFDVEEVPCEGKACPQEYLKHIKCKPSAFTLSKNGEFCLQMYRTVNFTGREPMKLFTGCVWAAHKQMKKMTVDTSS